MAPRILVALFLASCAPPPAATVTGETNQRDSAAPIVEYPWVAAGYRVVFPAPPRRDDVALGDDLPGDIQSVYVETGGVNYSAGHYDVVAVHVSDPEKALDEASDELLQRGTRAVRKERIVFDGAPGRDISFADEPNDKCLFSRIFMKGQRVILLTVVTNIFDCAAGEAAAKRFFGSLAFVR